MRVKTGVWIASVMVLVGLVCTMYVGYAQPPPAAPGAPGGAGAPGGGRGGPGGGRGGFGGGMGAGLMASPPAIVVANGKVYVVFLGTLFKLNADTLEVEAQAKLVPQGMEAMFQHMGAPGGGGAPAAGAAPAAPAPPAANP